MPARRSFLSLCFALSSSAACQRDLAPPPHSTIPTITAVAPARVFSGYTLTLTGANFDSSAASNLVQFPGVAVPASAIDPVTGGLQVLVPDGLPLSAPDQGGAVFSVSVSNSGGNSKPSPSLKWLGNGRPNLGTVLNTLRLLHRTPGIAATTAGVRIASSLFHAIIAAGASGVSAIARPPKKPSALTATTDGQAMLVGLDPGGVSIFDPAGKLLAQQPLGGASVQFVVPTGGANSRVFALGRDAAGALQAWAFLPASGAPVQTRELPLLAASGAAAAPDGATLVVAGTRSRGNQVAGVLLLTHPLDAAAADQLLDAPAGRTPTGAVAAWSDSNGTRAALALDDGSIAVFDLVSLTQVATLHAGSTTKVAALIALADAGGTKLIASKPGEKTVQALDALTGAAVWQVELSGLPTALALDPDGTRLHVSDDESNFTDAIRLSTGDPLHPAGQWLGRTSFLVDLGNAPGCACGAMPDYPASLAMQAVRAPRMLIVARALRQLLEVNPYSLSLHRGEVLSGTSAPLGLALAPDTTVWVLHETELGTVDGATETIVASGLPHPPTRVSFASDGSVLVGSLEDVTVVRKGAVAGGLHLPGSLALLEPRADGSALVLWSAGGGHTAGGGIFTIDALVANGPPRLALPALAGVQGFLGAVSQLSGPALFFVAGASQGAAAVTLDPATLQASAPYPSSVKERGPIAATPDGLYFFWTREASPDGMLHIGSYYDPMNGVLDYEVYPLGSTFGIPGLDPSGALSFTPMPDSDAVTVLQ